jgi:polysaccharide biosynthesis transport protein
MDHSNHLSYPSHPLETNTYLQPVSHVPNYGLTPPGEYEAAEAVQSGEGFAEYWQMFRRHRAAILLSALGGLILGYVVSLPMKPLFMAHTSIEILDVNEDFMNMKQANPVSNTSGSEETSEAQTQANLMQSNAVLGRVVAKLNSAQPAAQPSQAPTSGWRAWVHLGEPTKVSQRHELVAAVAASLKVKITAKTRLLDVTVNSIVPRLAADFANTLTDVFIQHNLDARLQMSQKTAEWLSRELEDERSKLRHAEDALQAYARLSGLIYTDENTSVTVEKLQQLQEQLSVATGDRIAKQSRFDLAKNSPPNALGDVLNDPGLRTLTTKLNDLQEQLADLEEVYDPEYSKVRRTKAQVEALESAFERDRSNILRRIENDYQESTHKEKLLTDAFDAQTRAVTGQGEQNIQYNILKRDVDSHRQLYDTMLLQLKQSSIASALRASNIRVVDAAEVPTAPFFPNFKINAALGMILGLFLSATVIVIRERSDQTLQQPGDLKLWTDVLELGAIPNATRASKKNIYGKPVSADREPRSDGSGPLLPRQNFDSVELVTWHHKPGVMAEAFRSVLTSVLFLGENGSRPRILVFTSAQPGEGKTTIVSNLAIALAEIRRRVLIIDADLRRPRMHDVFGLSNERGLGSLLQEELTEESLELLIQETKVHGLHVLTGGPPTSAAANLLYSLNFSQLLAILKKQYDMILIDTPPALQMTDARVAGRLADAVVLVARANKTTRDALLTVKKRFTDDRTRVIGSILNDWDSQNARAGYYKAAYYNSAYYNVPRNNQN